MHRRAIWTAILFLSVAIVGCAGQQGPPGPLGPAGPPGPLGPVGPAGQDASASQTYVGAEKCGSCHEETFAKFSLHAHAHALTKIENGQPPTFPYDDLTGGVMDPPEGYTWDDITYVNGGFGWKAQFIGTDGYFITGDENATTQYNFANEDLDAEANWSAYHAGEQKPYDCGVCHTTGYVPRGHQDNLEGIVGTWAYEGVQCERCHGPGSRHAEDPQGVRMVVDRSSQMCGACHAHENKAQIDALDGFVLQSQQYAEMYNSKHFAISCITCHDPHASALYADETVNPDQGISQVCESCHWAQLAVQNNRRHNQLVCTDCHMPPMGKSAQGDLDIFTGDVHAHQFSINPDPAAPQFSEDETTVMPYLSLTYACGQCHNGEYADVKDPEVMAAMADGYHDKIIPTPEPSPTPEPAPEATATPES